jgi:hypothetical protein
VLKAYLTDRGFHVASQSMQVHGGSGYTEHFPASQYLRDARITMIYEGANGIQALDLVGPQAGRQRRPGGDELLRRGGRPGRGAGGRRSPCGLRRRFEGGGKRSCRRPPSG